jgi:hypothetical protein
MTWRENINGYSAAGNGRNGGWRNIIRLMSAKA